MQTIRILFGLAAAAVAIYFVIQITVAYGKATGSTWDRLLSACRDSATVLWNKVLIVAAGIVATLGDVADAIGQPQIKDYVNQALGNPKMVAAIMLGASFVSIVARTRTLGK